VTVHEVNDWPKEIHLLLQVRVGVERKRRFSATTHRGQKKGTKATPGESERNPRRYEGPKWGIQR